MNRLDMNAPDPPKPQARWCQACQRDTWSEPVAATPGLSLGFGDIEVDLTLVKWRCVPCGATSLQSIRRGTF